VADQFPRWARVDAIRAIAAARTDDELAALVDRCGQLAQDQGHAEVMAAIRRRRVELAIVAGEAVGIAEHRRALERARADERQRVLEQLAAMAAELEGEARFARNRGRQLEAAAKDEHARLIRRAARRAMGGR
jgi:7,8-dihydro-6-hydroxymethylpterin-pyrophosphokinase